MVTSLRKGKRKKKLLTEIEMMGIPLFAEIIKYKHCLHFFWVQLFLYTLHLDSLKKVLKRHE